MSGRGIVEARGRGRGRAMGQHDASRMEREEP